MPILDIQRRVHEIGRIRLGEQDGDHPRALHTFRLTSPRRDLLDRAAELFGGVVEPWNSQWQVVTETNTLDVLVPPSDVSFSQWWEQWSAGGCARRCDGVRETINDTPCPCLADGNRVCEPVTRLSVILPAFSTFGVWRCETSSWYAAGELASAVELALQLAERTGQLATATLTIERRAVKRPGQPPRRFTVPVMDVALAPVHSEARTLANAHTAIGGQTIGPAELTPPPPAPRIPRGAPSPPPAEHFGDQDNATPPVLVMPDQPERPPLVAVQVDAPPPPTEEDRLATFRRGCFAQVRDVMKNRADNLNADALRYGLAILETAKRREEPVTSWNELTHEELTGVSTRLNEIKLGQLRVDPTEDGTGVVFTTTSGRRARIFTDTNGQWTFQVIEP